MALFSIFTTEAIMIDTPAQATSRIHEYARACEAAAGYHNHPLTDAENRSYQQFCAESMDLVDEERPPYFLDGPGREADRTEIYTLLQSIRAFRLRRMLMQTAPATALRIADSVARYGTDRRFYS
jgi:hypothetical protein